MAGIWERVNSDAADRIAVHFLEAGYVLHYNGTYTMQQIKNGLNSMLRTPLTAAENADLDAIAAKLMGLGPRDEVLYYLNLIAAWTIAAEAGKVSEAQFRAGLGI